MEQRSFILIIDMLAGHWAEDVVVPATGLQPPNLKGYVQAGMLPACREIIEQGVFVHAWNHGFCNTPHGQKYLASGSYRAKGAPGIDPYWQLAEGLDQETILYACKRTYPDGKVARFGSDAWMQTGWWKARDCTMGWGSYYSDFLTMQHCFHWMQDNPDWKMVLLYLAQYDVTGNCPVYREGAAYMEDKHHSLLEVDRYVWDVRKFLQENRWWDDTALFMASDHGCHYGCDVTVAEGRKRGIPEEQLANYCSNHQAPFDCHVWDFERDQATDRRSDCCRRTAFVVGGGALPPAHRGTTVAQAEITDFPATIARVMGVDLRTEGSSVL